MYDQVPENIVSKIQKLLALSSSPNEEEAALAYQKAHELLEKYNLEMSDIEDKPENIVTHDVWRSQRIERWYIYLSASVASNNFCASIVGHTGDEKAIRFIGRESNVASAKAIYWYLVEAIQRISKGKGMAYRLGMSDGLTVRLTPKKRTEEETTALTVVNKEAIEAREKLTGGRSVKFQPYSPDQEEYNQGYRDQNQIQLLKQLKEQP